MIHTIKRNVFRVDAVIGNCGRRGPNKRREPCSTEEEISLVVHISQHEIDIVAVEYGQWRLHRNHTRANFDVSCCSVTEFLTYLT